MGRIFGDRIMLREYQKKDLEYMRKWVNDPDITDYLSDIFLYPHTLNSTEEYLQMRLDNKGDEKGFIIANKETEEYIGQIGLMRIDWKNRVSELGIVIGNKEHLNKGYGNEALKLLQKFVFEYLNLHRLELYVHSYNERAYKCYLKSGFKEEGRKRECFYYKGNYFDHIFMAILKKEYEAMKEE